MKRAAEVSGLAGQVRKGVPMVGVPDVARTLEWYAGLGFTELGRFEDCGEVNFGMVGLGGAEVMFVPACEVHPETVSLWFYVDDAQVAFDSLKAEPRIEVHEELNDTFYGARQFGIRDLNGYILYFIQQLG